MKVLTISIAAYNVEKYLDMALESICNSSVLDEVEVIVVDDGSKDSTGVIGARYAEKYPNSIKSISKVNGGHGSTINTGLKEAKGKYFRVLDGDDWFDSEGFSAYVEKLKDVDTDMVISNKKLVYPNYEESVKFSFLKEGQIYNISGEYPYDICTLSTMAVKTCLLQQNEISITEKSFYVDLEFVVYSMLLSSTFCYINENVYMYRRGIDEQSVSKKNMLKNVKMLSDITEGLYNIVEKENTKEKNSEFAYNRIKNATGALYRTYFLIPNYNEAKEKIVSFESMLKDHHEDGYKKVGEDGFIRILRMMNYFFSAIVKKDIYDQMQKGRHYLAWSTHERKAGPTHQPNVIQGT